jgi:ABC-type glycerol-3-phosphate transport system substrate-binding protein
MITRWNKIAGLVLAAALTLATTACSSGSTPKEAGGEDAKASSGPVTLKVFMSDINVPTNILDNPVMTEIEKRIGVKLDFSPYTGGGDAKQKLSTLIASDDLPDLIFNADAETNNLLLKNKLIQPLDDLVKQHGPELEKNIKPGLDFSRTMYSDETKQLYFVPNLVGDESFYPAGYDLVFQIRGDLLKKMNKKSLNNLDDLLQFGIEAQTLEPKNAEGQKTYAFGIPFADHSGYDYIDWDTSHYTGLAQVKGFSYLDMGTNTLKPRFTDPDNVFWKSMSFFNKAYQAGILDPESATMKLQQVQDKGKALRYHIGMANWQIGWPNSEIMAKKDKEKGFIPTLLDTRKDYAFLRFSSPVGGGMRVSIPKSSKHADKAMEFLNLSASFDGAELFWNGPEGILWDMVDGKPQMKPENVNLSPEEIKKVGTSYVSPLMVLNGQKSDPRGWKVKFGDNTPERYAEGFTEVEKQFIKENNLHYPTQIFEQTKVISADTSMIDPVQSDPNSDIAAIETKIGNYLDINVAKVVYAKNEQDFNKAKETFIQDLKNMGIEKVMDFYKQGMEANKARLESVK